jgi:hypothetical protein
LPFLCGAGGQETTEGYHDQRREEVTCRGTIDCLDVLCEGGEPNALALLHMVQQRRRQAAAGAPYVAARSHQGR